MSSLSEAAVPAPAVEPHRRPRARGYVLLIAPLLLITLVLFVWPIVRTMGVSLYDGGFTLEHYARAFGDPIYLRVLWVTIKISALTTVICLLLGYPMAYLMAEAPSRIQAALLAIVTMSFFMSLLVKNYSWTILLQDTGVINRLLLDLGIIEQPLRLMYNLFGVLVGMVHMLLPFMILPLYSVFSRMDRSLLQASSSLGADPVHTFLNVTLPLSLPGVGAGVFLVFVVSLGFFITPALLGGPEQMMLSNLIDNQIRTVLNWPFGSALAMILLVIALAVYLLYVRLLGTERAWEQT